MKMDSTFCSTSEQCLSSYIVLFSFQDSFLCNKNLLCISMESIAALGLACSVIQPVGFSLKLVSKVSRLYNDGTLPENYNIERIVRDLQLTNTKLANDLELVDLDQDLNENDAHDETAITVTSWHNPVDIVRGLLDRGVKINARNHHGYSALSEVVFDKVGYLRIG